LLLVIGSLITCQNTFAQEVRTGIWITEVEASARKPFELGVTGEDEVLSIKHTDRAEVSTGLGSASAKLELEPAGLGVFPVLRAFAQASAQGEQGRGGADPHRNNGVGGGYIRARIKDFIVFKDHRGEPGFEEWPEEFGPLYIDILWDLSGGLFAIVTGDLPEPPRGFGIPRKEAFATAGYSLDVIGRSSAAFAKSTLREVKAGKVFEKPIDIKSERFEIEVDHLRFDPTEALELTFDFAMSVLATSESPAQTAGSSANFQNSVHFGGLRILDKDLNPLPPGSYSAIGATGIDWTLSNMPIGLTILEAERTQDNFTIQFTGPPAEVDWTVKGSTDLETFDTNLTPFSTITESAPGIYRAVIDVSGQSENLFIRVEL
jgi:hypothetical protein